VDLKKLVISKLRTPFSDLDDASPNKKRQTTNNDSDKLKECFDENLSVTEILNQIPKGDNESQEFFQKLGKFLLNQVVLVAGGKSHALREIEFYWKTEEHQDIFTHSSKVQETCGFWYFHRTGNNYRNGSYKGLDISIGRGKDACGGALIRSLEVLDNSGKFICGPSLSVDHILSMCNANSISELVDEKMKGDISVEKGSDTTPKILYLDRVSSNENSSHEVFRSPRVGLNLTKGSEKVELQLKYVYRFYRYFTKPTKIPKGKNLQIISLYHEGRKPDEISRLTGAQSKTVTKCIELYESGKSMQPETFLAKKFSDDEVCKAVGSILNRKSGKDDK